LATFCLSVHAANSEPLKLVQTIPLPEVKGRFDHFAIDAKGKRLFVAALGNNTLEIIDLAAGKRIQSVSGMSKPTGVLYLPEPNLVFVANGDDGTLKIFDCSTYKVSQNLHDLSDADNLRFDPATKLAWLGYGDGALGIIDAASPKLTASIKLSGHPESFQLEKQGPRIFVNVPNAKQVAVIDREKRFLMATLPMEKFQANFPMALDEPNHRLFIGCRKPARLVILDTNTGKPVADLAISGDTDDLFYDAKRKRLYISCGQGFIDIVEQSSPDKYQSITRIATAPGARTSFLSPDLDGYYLAVPDRGNQKAELRIYQPE
jgi:DNA-binding beta-propeller fold protein YncE